MSACPAPARYCYSVYGVRITSDAPFEFPVAPSAIARDSRGPRGPLAAVDFARGPDADFDHLAPDCEPDNGFVCVSQPDGRTYLRWSHLYEFIVSAGGSLVLYRPLDGCEHSVLQNFLFGQALGVSLVQQGVETLHAAVVCVDDGAVAFLGDCTFGKSTLLATFLQAGHRVLTDDLLILDQRRGEMVALPGAGRIKLLPDSASHFMPDPGSGVPLNAMTTKRSFPIEMWRRQRVGLPLRAIFVLPDPEERSRIDEIEICPASRVEVARELLKNTFTGQILDRGRLARQFDHATKVASAVDGFWLRYPSGLHYLAALREAIVEHVSRTLAQSAS